MAVSNGTDSVTATLTLNDIDVKFQLDTAAVVNTICQKHERQHQVSPTNVRLNMWNKTNLNLSGSPCSAYFDSSKEVVIQGDGSKHRIGAVLLQEGRPIEYASRALTPSERNWAQIEKEALAVLYGLERFDQYAYGRAVTVQN